MEDKKIHRNLRFFLFKKKNGLLKNDVILNFNET